MHHIVLPEWNFFQYLLVACRLGAMIGFLPTFSSIYIPGNIRIIMVLVLTILVKPIVEDKLPILSDNVIENCLYIFYEISIGLYIAIINIILISTIHLAGNIMSLQGGLSMASLFDPTIGEQSTLFARFLSMMSITFLFLSDFHYIIISTIIDSYNISLSFFTVVYESNIIDFVKQSFILGVKISMPILIMGTLFYFASGILNRLMPSLQILFVLTPLQVLGSFYMFMLVISSMVLWYFNHYEVIMVTALKIFR